MCALDNSGSPRLRIAKTTMLTHPNQPTHDHSSQPAWLSSIQNLVAKGGPEVEDYPGLCALIGRAAADVATGRAPKDALSRYLWSLGADFLADTMQGFSLSKPHGYAGDFEIIDRIYTRRVSARNEYRRWDEFFHAQAAPKAVRNRADVIGRLLSELADLPAQSNVLNVGSGPGRDIATWLSSNPTARVQVTCIDRDPKALAYSRTLLSEEMNQRVQLIEANALRYRADRRYDLVWSAGLFDYLSDGLAVLLLKRLLASTQPGGRIVVGNFSPENSTRQYMELFGEWFLIHRDAGALCKLAEQAGGRSYTVFSEAEGVNLFLVIYA